MSPIRRILVPTDFSAHADEAFRTACNLAGPFGAEVVVFHVAQPPAVVTAGGEFVAQPETAPVNLWDGFRDLLCEGAKVHVRHEVIVADRPSARHILDMLDKQGCDLIVMGTHGRSWAKHLLFGSVTEAVVRAAHCPVMVVKPSAARAEHGRVYEAATAQPHAWMT